MVTNSRNRVVEIFTRVPCGSDKYGLNDVLYTHAMMIDDHCFPKTFSHSKVERLVFFWDTTVKHLLVIATATCSRDIARKWTIVEKSGAILQHENFC